MKDNINFKKLWQQQDAEPPKVEDLYNKINRFKRNNLSQLIVVNVLLLITIVIMGLILYYYQPTLITTTIGIILMVLTMAIYLISYNSRLFVLFERNSALDSKAYLEQLIILKEKQRFQQTTLLTSYFIFLSLGIGLYLLEFALQMPFIWGGLSYGLTIVWIAINWWYLRPKVIKKQNGKINALIVKCKEVTYQLNS